MISRSAILEYGGKRSATPPFFAKIVLSILFAFVFGCSPAPEPSATPEAPIAVRAVHPHPGEIYRHIDLPGEVHPLLQATIFAKVDGYLAKLTVDKGDSVKEGDLLAEIEAPDLRANELKYHAELELAQAEFNQIAQSPTNQSANLSPAEAEAARNRVAVANAKLSTARAYLEATQVMLNYTRISAPFDGIITKRFVDPGAYIPVPNAADTPEAAAIVNVTDFQTLRLQVAVPENEVRHVKLGQPVRWTTDALPGEHFDGTVTRAYWALDRATKTMLTEVQLTNRDMLLRPGMLVNAHIALEKKAGALLLPVETLFKEKTTTFVYVATNSVAKKIAVRIGFNDGANFEVVDGVRAEDVVLVLRDQPLRDGQTVSVTESK